MPTGTRDRRRRTDADGANENHDNGQSQGPPKPGDYKSTCEPIDLTPYLDGTIKPVMPTLGRRSDGVCLLYRGKMHSLVGESEAGKTWLALLWCADEIRLGHHVTFIDCDDSSPEGIVERLLALGLTTEEILEYFHYIRPQLVLNVDALKKSAERSTLTVLDGVTEAMAMTPRTEWQDWNMQWMAFQGSTLRPLASTGTALVMIDHPNRADGKEPSRHAGGAGGKLRGIDGGQYILHATEPCGRGMRGTARVYVAKDRKGHVRQHGTFVGAKVQMVHIATLVVDDSKGGSRGGSGTSTTVMLDPPEGFRPTVLMARISQAAASEPDTWQSKNQLANKASGNRAAKLTAVTILAKEGYLRTRNDDDAIVYQHARVFTETTAKPTTRF